MNLSADHSFLVSALADFCARPAWPDAEVKALVGLGKGSLFKDWAAHVERRYGRPGVAALRDITGIHERDLPDQPDIAAWYPIRYQIQLMRAAADRWFGGDVLAMEPGLRDDALRARPRRWTDRLMRLVVTPRRVFSAGARIHASLYDIGRADTRVTDHSAEIVWSGARFMAEPTWGILQAIAIRGLFVALGRPEPHLDAEPRETGLVMRVTW